jgi:nucleoid DNA-binding protein
MANNTQHKIIKLPEDFVMEIRNAIIEFGKVKVTGLGIFETRSVKARRGRNPRNGKELVIPPYTKVKFRPTSSLKEAVI